MTRGSAHIRCEDQRVGVAAQRKRAGKHAVRGHPGVGRVHAREIERVQLQLGPDPDRVRTAVEPQGAASAAHRVVAVPMPSGSAEADVTPRAAQRALESEPAIQTNHRDLMLHGS